MSPLGDAFARFFQGDPVPAATQLAPFAFCSRMEPQGCERIGHIHICCEFRATHVRHLLVPWPLSIACRAVGLAKAGKNPASASTLIANDNWTDDPAAAALLSANGLAPADSNESAIYKRLPPGQFTAILAGKNGGTGIGIIEVYNLRCRGPSL